MDPSAAEIEQQRWSVWLAERNRRGLRIALFIGGALYPAFGVVDWLMAPPSLLPALWAARAVIVLVTIALLAVLPSPRLAPWLQHASAAYAWLAGAAIAV